MAVAQRGARRARRGDQLRRVFSDLTERKAEEDRISFLAQHDALTGLPNRLLLADRLTQALASASRHGGQVALLFLDLDRFKVINDSLGHRVGDLLLCSVAARLQSLIREEDTVARLGGDEFVFVIPHSDRPEMPAHVAQKIIWAMAEPHDIEGERFAIGASVGISLYPADAADGEMLIRNADSAMYKAKSRGGNCYEFYTANMTSRAMERMILENSLRGGLERDQFVIFLPAAGGAGHRPHRRRRSAAALVPSQAGRGAARPLHPGRRGDRPDRRHRRLGAARRLPAEQALAAAGAAADPGRRQRRRAPVPAGMVDSVRRALAETGLEARYLELELTETTLMGDVGAVLHQLKALGVQLSIDDFGVGYSSLSYLKRFPIDNLKIDKSLIAEIGIGDRNSSIAGAAISLAHSLNLTVTAEGAYAAWQARYLRERGCDLVQGYYFSRPLPPNRFAALLRHGKSDAARSGLHRPGMRPAPQAGPA